jgi:hypothetical protein
MITTPSRLTAPGGRFLLGGTRIMEQGDGEQD